MNKSLSIVALLASAVSIAITASGESISSQIVSVALKAPLTYKGERIVGFEFHIECGVMVAMRRLPIGWTFGLDNDPSWNTSVDGVAIVGTAALDEDDFADFLTFEKCTFLDSQVVNIWGNLSVTRDFDNVRTINLKSDDFVLYDASTAGSRTYSGHEVLEPVWSDSVADVASVLVGLKPLKFELSSIPRGRRVDQATLLVSISSSSDSYVIQVDSLDAVVKLGDSCTVATRCTPPLDDYLSICDDTRVGLRRVRVFDMTRLVGDWVAGVIENEGILFMPRRGIDTEWKSDSEVFGKDINIELSVYYSE